MFCWFLMELLDDCQSSLILDKFLWFCTESLDFWMTHTKQGFHNSQTSKRVDKTIPEPYFFLFFFSFLKKNSSQKKSSSWGMIFHNRKNTKNVKSLNKWSNNKNKFVCHSYNFKAYFSDDHRQCMPDIYILYALHLSVLILCEILFCWQIPREPCFIFSCSVQCQETLTKVKRVCPILNWLAN